MGTMQTFGGATPLMYACQQCRENQVLEILKKQPYAVKDRDRTLKTPLHYCAENPNTSCAETLLKFAPELVNAQDENGYCTLHLAVIAGNKSLIKLLIAKGADVNIYDNEGHSAVHWAIVSSEKEALEMIIQARANPSTPDIHGGYPLHYAVQMCGSNNDYIRNYEDTIRVVETLLNSGVDVNVKDKDGRQPILWAASAGSADAVVQLVSGGACVEAADKDGLTALHCAASRGHTTTLDTLITLCGTNVDVIDGNGCSALFYSVTLGHADATELLLELGAEPNRQDRKGRTPAHCGAAKGQLETLRILQKHGGNLWLRNVKGDIPLHEAVASGRKDLVLWLLSQNPEAVNIANNDGRCPLHIAAMYNNTEMVKVLLDAKSLVNPVMRTSKGVLMTPLNVALCKGHRSCGKYLQLHGGVPFSKVAKIEPASAFTFKVSPSTEVINNSGEISIDNLPLSKTKVSVSNTSTDIQIIKAETTDKKKIYRRRKKRKTFNKDDQDSDSDKNIPNVRTKMVEYQKNDQDENKEAEVDEDTDENDEKIGRKKVQLNIGKNPKNAKEKISKTDSVNIKSEITLNDTVVQETLSTKRVAKPKSEPKPLPRNKSLKESKNVNNLSPDDFPPLMQTVNQIDTVIIESQEDLNKSAIDDDIEDGLRTPNLPVDELSGNEQTTDASKKEKEEVKIEVKLNDETQMKKEMDEKKIKKEVEQNEKETPFQNEKFGKSVNSSKNDDGKKDEKVFQSAMTKSSADEDSEQKTEKTIKSSTRISSNDGIKKDNKSSKSGTPKSCRSDGNGESKKFSSPKGAKNEALIPVSEKFEKKVEKVEVQTSEKQSKYSEGKEENPPLSVETRGENESPGNEKPDEESKISSSRGNTLEDKHDAAREFVSEEIKLEKMIERTPEVESKEIPNIEGKSFDEKLPIPANESPTEKDNTVANAPESVPIQQIETVQFSEPLITEEMVLKEDRNSVEKGSLSVSVLAEEPQREARDVTDAIEVPNNIDGGSGLNYKVPEVGRTDITVERPTQNNSDFGLPVTSKQESAFTEEHKSADLSTERERIKTELAEIIETHSDDGNTSKATPVKVSDSPTGERINNQEAKETNENTNPHKNSRTERTEQKETNHHREQRQNKPAKVPRLCRRHKELKDDVNQGSITQLVQSTIRKYHMERGIFYQLLELKRYQIRSGKANEQVLVKRLADEYERSRTFLGMKPYTGLYKFREFEKFLYDQLKALNRRSFIIPEIKSYDDIDAMSGFLKKSRYKIISEIPQPEMVCTCITQRCHHSACAYTSVPCSAYIADLRHHKHHKKRKECFFPLIDQPQINKSDSQKYSDQPATLELVQGNQKQVITLPQNCPDKTKRYYVTFTIKGVANSKEEDVLDNSRNCFKHRHAKSV